MATPAVTSDPPMLEPIQGPTTGSPVVRRLCILIILFAGVLAYAFWVPGSTLANSLSGVWVLDDNDHIVNNESIHAITPLKTHLFYFYDRRPVPRWTFLFNYVISGKLYQSAGKPYAEGGLNPLGYHIVNLLIHLIAALAFFGVVRRTLRLRRFDGRFDASAEWVALACALFWMLHPIQTQAVTYVVQRFESMMGMFFMLMFYATLRGATSQRRWWAWYSLAVVFFWLGILSKEVMIAAPLVLLAYDAVFLSPSVGRALRRRWSLYVAFLGPGIAGLLVLGISDMFTGTGRSVGFSGVYTPGTYLLSQGEVILHYLRLVVWPKPLCLDYFDWRPPDTVGQASAWLWACLACVGLMFLASLWGLWMRHWLGFLGFAFFIVLAPTSSFMPIRDVVMEHRMYVPLAPVIIAIVIGGWAALDYARRLEPEAAGSCRIMGAGLILSVTLLFTVRTILRNDDYGSAVAIYRSITVARPTNPRGWRNLAAALATDRNLPEASRMLTKALQLKPGDSEGWLGLGQMYRDMGNRDKAIDAFKQGIRLGSALPEFAHVRSSLHQELAVILMLGKPGEVEEAKLNFRQAAEEDPANFRAYEGLAQMEMFDHPGEAEGLLKKAVSVADPLNAVAIQTSLANFYMMQGRFADAAQACRQALARAPNSAALYSLLGKALYKDGKLDVARQADMLAANLTNAAKPRDPDAVNECVANLAELAIAEGRYEEGIKGLRDTMASSFSNPGKNLEYASNLAWALATVPPPAGNRDEALKLAEYLNQKTGGNLPSLTSAVAAALAAQGRFKEALDVAQRALEAAQRSSQIEMERRLQHQIKAYQAGHTWMGTPETEPAATQATGR